MRYKAFGSRPRPALETSQIVPPPAEPEELRLGNRHLHVHLAQVVVIVERVVDNASTVFKGYGLPVLVPFSQFLGLRVAPARLIPQKMLMRENDPELVGAYFTENRDRFCHIDLLSLAE